MGTQAEMEATSAPSSHTKATFSGTTAFIGVLALIINIISVAVPHWGSYSPGGVSYFSSGKIVFLVFPFFVMKQREVVKTGKKN